MAAAVPAQNTVHNAYTVPERHSGQQLARERLLRDPDGLSLLLRGSGNAAPFFVGQRLSDAARAGREQRRDHEKTATDGGDGKLLHGGAKVQAANPPRILAIF
jgi:hypothetical protein